MNKEKDIVEAISFATLLTSKEVVGMAEEGETRGLVMAAVLKKPIQHGNGGTKTVCVAKFGFFATTILTNTDSAQRQVAVEVATRHLRFGKSLNMALGSSFLSSQLSGCPGIYGASCLDVCNGLAVGVSGGSQENNYTVARGIMKATRFYLPLLLGSKLKRPDPDVTQALWVARADILERFRINMQAWSLPASWDDFTFWQQKLFKK
ncbi:MAG: hypothetical protein WCG97_03835 [bacterium]